MTLIVRFALSLIGLFVAVWMDCTQRRIRNELSVLLAVLGLCIGLAEGWSGVKRFLLGLALSLLVGIVLWLLNIFKAGDAKLIAALGAIMGWRWTVDCLCYAVLTGAVFGVMILLIKGELRSRTVRIWEYFKSLYLGRQFRTYSPEEGTQGELPFTIPLLAGCILTYFYPLLAA